MQVTLYRYSGKANILEKQLPTTSTNRLIINADYGFEGNQDVDRIYININSTTKPLWTYAYIDSFYRYYFVTNTTWLSGSLWRLSLRCDLLQTFASTIKAQSGTVIYSGLGDGRRYDPRLVYNLPPVKTSVVGGMGYNYSGDDPYIVMACRYMDYRSFDTQGVTFTANNQMRYLIFTPVTYQAFVDRYFSLVGSNEQLAVAVANTIVSLTVVRWLNLTGIEKQRVASFGSPEIFKLKNERYPQEILVATESSVLPDFWQITAEEYHNKRYLAFLDSCSNYAERKAQRLIDIPYVGQVNVDLDNLGIPATTSFYLCAEISYDFGGNEYVVSLGTAAPGATSAVDVSYRREEYTTFSNTYTANFVTDASYNAEKETRNAQILSMVGTAVGGIVSGIVTEGATIPATIASLGIGAANFALSEQKLEYQKASSMKLNGSSNGGSAYNCLKYVSGSVTYPIYAKLYKKTSNSSTDPAAFAAEYGKPDGAFRTLSSLAGTGYAQMGTVTLDGFNSATEIERDEIKNLLLSGVIY
jgi:hypothetical protein